MPKGYEIEKLYWPHHTYGPLVLTIGTEELYLSKADARLLISTLRTELGDTHDNYPATIFDLDAGDCTCGCHV